MTTTTPEMFTDHRFRQAFAEVQPRLAAIPAESLLTINLDIPSAVVMVLGSAPEIRALRSEVVEQLPRFDIATFDAIETFALAAAQAHTLHLAASAPPQPVQELSEQLTTLRETLVIDVTALEKRGLIDGRLGELRGAVGYKNLAFDVLLLSTVLRESWSKIEGKTGVQLAELGDPSATPG